MKHVGTRTPGSRSSHRARARLGVELEGARGLEGSRAEAGRARGLGVSQRSTSRTSHEPSGDAETREDASGQRQPGKAQSVASRHTTVGCTLSLRVCPLNGVSSCYRSSMTPRRPTCSARLGSSCSDARPRGGHARGARSPRPANGGGPEGMCGCDGRLYAQASSVLVASARTNSARLERRKAPKLRIGGKTPSYSGSTSASGQSSPSAFASRTEPPSRRAVVPA